MPKKMETAPAELINELQRISAIVEVQKKTYS